MCISNIYIYVIYIYVCIYICICIYIYNRVQRLEIRIPRFGIKGQGLV